MLPLLTYPISDRITAFSTTREGGVSIGNYATFNCTHYCGDHPEHVAENRKRLCKHLGIHPSHLILPHQTHSTTHRLIDGAFLKLTPEAQTMQLEGVDSLITQMPQVAICVSTADCVPIIIYDPRHSAAAVIHAGWRGTAARIACQTLQAMHDTFATNAADCMAIIGPSISRDSFEVGDEVYEEFHDAGFDMNNIAIRNDKWHIDLWQCNRIQLQECGLKTEKIYTAGICTFIHHDQFFSARRLGINSGRMLTGIIIRQSTQETE